MKHTERRTINLRSERGQSLTEFALALPILALLLFAVIQFGIVFNNYVTLTDATRAGLGKPPSTGSSRIPRAGRSRPCGLPPPTQAERPGRDRHLHVAAERRRDRHGDLPVLDQPPRHGREERSPVQHDYGACGMRTRSDKGQATVLTLVFLVVLLGMAALVLDVGSWYRADRAVQSTADAAALAGAQSLPYNPGNASTLAVQYGDKNGGGVNGSGITISNSSLGVNDTITVHLTRPAPGVFTKLFGVNSVTVGAHATARASLMQQAQYIAPIGVNLKHPKLKGTISCPCFGVGNPTTLPLGKTGAPGAFDLLNVDGSHGGLARRRSATGS